MLDSSAGSTSTPEPTSSSSRVSADRVSADRRTLRDLPVGGSGRIASHEGEPALVQRLLEMGLTPGASVQVLRVAPLGDPMEIRVRGYSLSIRKADAAHLVLEVDG